MERSNQFFSVFGSGGSSSGGATSLGDLTDVTLTSLETQQVLKYNGTNWENNFNSVNMIEVRNDEGATIPIGSPLYSKGEIGGSNRILVGIADADDPSKMPCIGIAKEEMNTSDTKDNYGVVSGVYNENLTGFTGLTEGDVLYVSKTGTLTQTKPTGSNDLIQNVGIVIKTNGTICQGLLVSAIGRTNDVPNSIDINGSIVGGYIYSPQSATNTITSNAVTIDGNNGNSQPLDLASATSNVSVTFTNLQAGATYFIKIIQKSSSPVDITTWTISGGNCKAPSGTISIGQGASEITTLVLYYDGTDVLINYSNDYQNV